MEKRNLPNATAVLILGICSILTCCCYGIVGLILGVVALVLYKKDMALYKENPELYSNYSNLNIGRILAIIGVVIGGLYFLFIVFMYSYYGEDEMLDMMENLKVKMEQTE